MTDPQPRATAVPSSSAIRGRLGVPAAVVLLITSVAIACGGPAAPPTPSATRAASAAPSLTPVPGPTARATAVPSIGQTDSGTAIGRIWDEVPTSFPGLSGSSALETGSSSPTSGTFAVRASSVVDAVAVVKAGLLADRMKVDAGSPLEDGSVVMEARGGTSPTCKIEVRFASLSGTITMTVLYGAACPSG